MEMQNRVDKVADKRTSAKQSSADKALEVLMALGQLGIAADGGVRLSDLVAHLAFPRPTVHRLLGDLKKANFVAQDQDSNRYRLGTKILLLSAQCLGGMDIRRIAQPLVSNLVARIGSTSYIGIRDGANIIYIDKYESLHSTRLASTIGQRRRVTNTSLGKAILAFTHEDDVDAVIAEGLTKSTPNSIAEPEALKRELRKVRQRGWAIDDEECEVGIRCAAAPIFNHASQVVAALSMSFIANQVRLSDLKDRALDVAEVAARISQELGYSGANRRQFDASD